MSIILILLGILGVGAIVAVIFVISIYNGLVTKRNYFKNAFSQIDVQLKRRYDLIPNLMETAKGYMKHERETLEAVIQARAGAMSARNKAAKDPTDGEALTALVGAEATLGGAMGKFFGLMESYPDLKANQNIAQLMEELTSTENKIAFARQSYNDYVMEYNTSIEVFPNSIIAGTFNFKNAELFEITDVAQKEAPRVSF